MLPKSLSSCSTWICFIDSLFLSIFQTALQTLELFLFLLSLAFYDISDKFTVFLCICAPHQSSHVLSSSSSSSHSCPGWLFGKKMPSLLCLCHSTCQKVSSSVIHSVSLCERVKSSCKSCCKADIIDCC